MSTNETTLQLGTIVLLEIADRLVAISAEKVSAVIEIESIVATPGAPPFVTGLAALRSRAITVIDTRLALGLTDGVERGSGSRFPVVEVDGQGFALACDRVVDICEPRSGLDAVPMGTGPVWSRIALGTLETQYGPALLINVARLIEGPAQVAEPA